MVIPSIEGASTSAKAPYFFVSLPIIYFPVKKHLTLQHVGNGKIFFRAQYCSTRRLETITMIHLI